MINPDHIYWDLSDMPMITLYIYINHNPGYLTCPGSKAEENAYYRLEIKSAVYKKLFWTSCRTSAPPVLGEGTP